MRAAPAGAEARRGVARWSKRVLTVALVTAAHDRGLPLNSALINQFPCKTAPLLAEVSRTAQAQRCVKAADLLPSAKMLCCRSLIWR
jgi:hypothetical protein